MTSSSTFEGRDFFSRVRMTFSHPLNFQSGKLRIFANSKIVFPTRLISLLLIIFGAVLLFRSSLDFVVNSKYSQEVAVIKNGEVRASKLYIASMDRSLSISEGHFVDGRWIVSESGVSHYTESAIPGEAGNAVLYGHNKDDILGGLWRVQSGDLLYVVLSDGSIAKYKVFERKEVKPNEVQILNDVGDSRLTLYTCSGFLDSARYVIVGDLIS